MPIRFPKLVLVATLALAACNTSAPVTSQFVGANSDLDEPISGTVYALPLSRLRVTVAPNDKNVQTMTVTRVNYADFNARYVAQAASSASSNDEIALGTTVSGLLNVATATSDEVSDEIVKTAVDSVSSIIAAPGTVGQFRVGDTPKNVDALIDPYTHAGGQGITVRRLAPTLPRAAGGARQRCPENTSICVPVMVPYEISYSSAKTTAKTIIAVPDPHAVIGIRMQRRPCVQTVNTLSVSDGILTKFEITKPSEIVGCLSIPLDVITAIISAPVNAFRSETTVLKAQKDLIQAQADLLSAQAALTKAQQPATGE